MCIEIELMTNKTYQKMYSFTIHNSQFTISLYSFTIRNSQFTIKIIFFLLFFSFQIQAQTNVNIEISTQEIALNEPFSIIISVEDKPLEDVNIFPELTGLIKYGTINETTTKEIAGRRVLVFKIIQNYYAKKMGKYPIKAFQMRINDQNFNFDVLNVTVSAPNGKTEGLPEDYEKEGLQEEVSFKNIKDEVFFGLSVDKTDVVVGEGFNVILAIYIAEKSSFSLNFKDLGKELSAILKQIKPQNCWEEDFNIVQITPNQLKINRKSYNQYKIYQASYFPLVSGTIFFPAVSISTLNKETSKENTFETQSTKIKVRKLPFTQLKGSLEGSLEGSLVGNFYLDEAVSSGIIRTGESFTYSLALTGEGNVVGVQAPTLIENAFFEFYPPTIVQSVRRIGDKIFGTKVFNYQIIPKNAGNFSFKTYFSYVTFNLNKKKYDTLRPKAVFKVEGATINSNLGASAAIYGEFYRKVLNEDTNLYDQKTNNWLLRAVNVFLGIFIIVTLFFWIIQNRKKP